MDGRRQELTRSPLAERFYFADWHYPRFVHFCSHDLPVHGWGGLLSFGYEARRIDFLYFRQIPFAFCTTRWSYMIIHEFLFHFHMHTPKVELNPFVDPTLCSIIDPVVDPVRLTLCEALVLSFRARRFD